ncbi:nitroreductase [Neolewinella agarilytica]|uniref:nitroreductase family protein n=1 Tax=Neolewinella agarilytica TaxID=478744 RepID=UPI002354A058|nr:nitroreductase [Neolewinella agarilytica]
MLSHIKNRRSVYTQFFTDKPVDKAIISALLDAANHAPNHKKTEPWRFRVYTGNGKKQLHEEVISVFETLRGPDTWSEKLDKKFGGFFTKSPVVIAIFLHRDPAESLPEWEEVAAVGCAVENLWTSLDSYKLGGYWSSPTFLCDSYGQWPSAADNEKCLGLFYLGYHEAPELPRQRGDWEEKVTWIE